MLVCISVNRDSSSPAATNTLAHHADIAKVQEWLGHATIATTRLYDRRQSRPEEGPTLQEECYGLKRKKQNACT